jgi:hypothetical protein
MTKRLSLSLLVAIWAVALMPALASAQSSITGSVSDNTGGALPGVTVEAASPVLIEGSRIVVTDGSGLYTVVNLRPGTYSLTFTLPGFGTLVRDEVPLSADFSATVDAQLSIGSLEETITVSGAAPVVDVTSAARTQVLSRETLDTIPTSRTGQGMGAIIVGVRLNRPDMGGTRATENSRMSVHGGHVRDASINVDGLSIDAQDDGGIQGYYNEAMTEEISYTTNAQSAETQKGGVRMNMIGREGGNTFSGSSYISGSDGGWQANNVTQRLIDRGLTSTTGMEHISDLTLSQGGPIFRNKLWFYFSARSVRLDEVVAGTFFLPDGVEANHIPPTADTPGVRPTVADQFVRSASGRMTYQVLSSSKLSAYFDRAFKNKNFSPSENDDPATFASYRPWRTHMYYTSNAKWTSTLSSRALLEVGYSGVLENRVTTSQPGVDQLRFLADGVTFNPAWIANATRYDFVTDRNWKSRGLSQATEERFLIQSSLTYVTGSHNFKGGVQWFFGPDGNSRTFQGDLRQRYRNGVPEGVDVYNTPRYDQTDVNADLGIYFQDSWTLDRLTFNPGVRIDYFNASLAETYMPAGRFVTTARIAPASDGPIPEWWDINPRFSAAYDVFGDARTALKLSASKYVRPVVDEITRRYSPVFSDSDRRDWFDVALTPGTDAPSGIPMPTDGDDIAQAHEIGPSNDAGFGIRADRLLNNDFQREYNWEYSVSLQHEVVPGFSLTGGWYRRSYGDLWGTQNTVLETSDYTGFDVASPVDGSPVTVYNLNPALRGQGIIEDLNSKDNANVYNGFELSFDARLPNGGGFFGGLTSERSVLNNCETDNPNNFRFCDQSLLDIPFRSEYKLAGFYPLPGDFIANMSLISWPGVPLRTQWSVPRGLFPNGQRTQSVTVNLAAPGSKYAERYTQFDVGVKKIIRLGGLEVHGDVTVFNLLNVDAIVLENERFGGSLGIPTRTAQGRLLRLAAQLKW